MDSSLWENHIKLPALPDKLLARVGATFELLLLVPKLFGGIFFVELPDRSLLSNPAVRKHP